MSLIHQENQQLLKDILERNYFSNFRQKNNTKSIELFITGKCLQNCQYCYVKKHQNELYPINIDKDENIINNLSLFLDYYISNEFLCNINLFSGEWLSLPISQKIFQIIYNKFSKTIYKPKRILIPDNMSFISDKKQTELIQYYIDLFKTIDINLILSASIDGKFCDNDRKKHNDLFYELLFKFCEKNNFLCHPMISSNNIDKWKDNYLWWQNTAPSDIAKHLMMLEVRDETWDNNKIEIFLYFLDFLIDYQYKNNYNENLKLFIENIFCLTPDNTIYWPGQISNNHTFDNLDTISCSLQHTLMIRLGDLSIGLCHRLFYNDLLIGNFIINNNKIIDIEEQHVELQIIKDHMKFSCLPHCEQCLLNNICPGFCLGNSYENYKNFLVPTKETCMLQKAKICFLIKKYHDLGVFNYIKETDIIKERNFKQYLLDLEKNLLIGVQ